MNTAELYKIFTRHPVITTDTRNCPADSIFFALHGDTFNGNAFAAKALEAGCAYAVVDEPQYANADDDRYLMVPDSLKALQDLARHHRRQMPARIIGITGTNGKTTTKELIAAVLAEKYNVLYTQGNFNNHIGVPKTLLRLKPEHEVGVIEMGANHPGEIACLAGIAEPDCGMITNVGKAHLEGFGSFEGVIKTKGELYDFLRTKPKSTVFIDNDNPYLRDISQGLKLVRYGCRPAEDLLIEGQAASSAPLLQFRWRHSTDAWHDVGTQLIGSYNLTNLLAAACVGLYFGIAPEQIDHALSHYTPGNNRSQLAVTAHNRLIIDAYNANPTSMNAALTNFEEMDVPKKMAILGDMKELGTVSHAEHQKLVDGLRHSTIHTVWLVGEEFGQTETDFRKFRNVEEVKQALEKERPEGYHILIKGSHGTRLYTLPEVL